MKGPVAIAFIILSIAVQAQQNDNCAAERHTPFLNHAWLSCNERPNPNPAHGMSHWIQFDFGESYIIDSTWIWNYNAWGLEMLGVRDVIVEHSLNGSDWVVLDTASLPKALGSYKDVGAPGPVFDDTNVRFVLLTVLSMWGADSPCAGLSEIRFEIGEQTTSVRPDIANEVPRLTVFPNPASDQVSLHVPEDERLQAIQVMDVNGLVLYSLLPTRLDAPLDVSHLPAGIYLIRAMFEQGTSTQKLIVARR